MSDTTVDADDEVQLYIDWEKSASEGAAVTPVRMTRAEGHEQEGGYIVEFTVPKECKPAMNFSMDIVVSDHGKQYAFNDMTMNQGTSSKYYASAITKPYMTIAKVGKDVIKVDGEQEAAWETIMMVGKRSAVPDSHGHYTGSGFRKTFVGRAVSVCACNCDGRSAG